MNLGLEDGGFLHVGSKPILFFCTAIVQVFQEALPLYQASAWKVGGWRWVEGWILHQWLSTIFFFLFFFFLRRSFTLVTQAGVSWHDLGPL